MKIKITTTTGGSKTKEGKLLTKHFAYYINDNCDTRFFVTHLPTGYSLGYFGTLEIATKAAEMAEKEIKNVESTNPREIEKSTSRVFKSLLWKLQHTWMGRDNE